MRKKLLYWIPTTLLLLVMMGSAIFYFLKTEDIITAFAQLGYPAYTVYFNATAKILGGLALLLPVPRYLKEFAYAGYLYIMLLATQAVVMTMPGIPYPMIIFLLIWLLSYWQFRVQKIA